MASVISRFAALTEKEILQILTFLECVVLSPSLCMLLYNYSLQSR